MNPTYQLTFIRGNMNKSAIETHNTQIIAIGNQKGGVGKTTNTVHIARALVELGRKVLIFDLDMNHGATRHFGIPDDAFLGTYEVLVGEENPLDVLVTHEDEDVELPDNLHLITARRKLEGIDQALSAKSKFIIAQDVLKEPLRVLHGLYDYVFLDTAPNATAPTIAAYTAAKWFILSAMPDPFAIGGLTDALSDIQDAQRQANRNLRLLGVVVTGVDKRTTLSHTLTDYVEQVFSHDGKSAKFQTVISRSTAVPTSQKLGKTLFETHPAHRVTDEYRALAQEVESRIQEYTQLELLEQQKVKNG